MKAYKTPLHIRREREYVFSFALWVAIGSMFVLVVGLPLIVAAFAQRYGVSWQ